LGVAFWGRELEIIGGGSFGIIWSSI